MILNREHLNVSKIQCKLFDAGYFLECAEYVAVLKASGLTFLVASCCHCVLFCY